MDTRRDVFQAIADPTRRQIIEMLVKKPLHVNEIAENFEMTRQAHYHYTSGFYQSEA
ncbi:MAG TPA: ArsR family transcriptional regulator [Emticicia sp.]